MPEMCRSCKAPVIRGISASSQKMIPLDRFPVSVDTDLTGAPIWRRGLFALDEDSRVATAWKKGTPKPDGLLYQSHFASCPHADAWRKP